MAKNDFERPADLLLATWAHLTLTGLLMEGVITHGEFGRPIRSIARYGDVKANNRHSFRIADDYTEVDAPLGTKRRFTKPEVARASPLLSLSRVVAGQAM